MTREQRLTETPSSGRPGRTAHSGRGAEYVRYVRGLRVVGSTALATIQAKRVYLVELDWPDGVLTGRCTCPHAARGAFCKHQVAVGLCVVDRAPAPGPVAELGAEPSTDEALLDGLSPEELRSILRELMDRDPAVQRLVELRAPVQGDVAERSALLVELTSDALRTRGFVDYRRSFDVARDAQDLLDELESELDAGHADAVRPALLRATNRLQKITLNGDDSAGVLGDACQRAAELYARSCCDGSPDTAKLARWLVKFRIDSPGWPELELTDFRDAFDDKGWRAYRRAVEKAAEAHRDAGQWARRESDRMRLELADHDGDVDAALEILSAGEHPSYGAIVDRLRAARRLDELVAWTDLAVTADAMSRHGHNEFMLAPDEVAQTYLDAGRVDDAVEVLRRAFSAEPGAARFKALVRFAAPLGREQEEREWALATAHDLAKRPYGTGAPLIEIALGEQDLDAAWAAAERHGPGHLWQPLSDASATTRPRPAADLYWPGIEEDLRFTDSKKYAGIADRLARMRDLYAAAGDDADFAALMTELRTTYGRRPSLMAAFNLRRLP